MTDIARGVRPSNRREGATPSEDTPEDLIEHRARAYPGSSRSCYRRAMGGRSRKDSIHAFCIMCFGYQPRYVEGCTDSACPLYPFRNGEAIERR